MEYDQTVKKTNFTLGILHALTVFSATWSPHVGRRCVSIYFLPCANIFILYVLIAESSWCDGRAATELGEVFHCKLAAGRRGRG